MPKKGTRFVPCTACGGSGAITVQEIDRKGKVTTVRKVCPSCGGKGGFHI